MRTYYYGNYVTLQSEKRFDWCKMSAAWAFIGSLKAGANQIEETEVRAWAGNEIKSLHAFGLLFYIAISYAKQTNHTI